MTGSTAEHAEGAEPGEAGRVAVLTPHGEDPADYFHVITHGSGTPQTIEPDGDILENAGALLAIGTSPFQGRVPKALATALELKMAILGVGWGMHAINVALGGREPVAVPGASIEPVKMPVFISPGGKLSYTIAGSGWVSVPFSNTEGVRSTGLAPGLFASCYREDGFMAAIEMPGRNWVIGVQWNAHEVESMPSGFDSLLLALVERAAGVQ